LFGGDCFGMDRRCNENACMMEGGASSTMCLGLCCGRVVGIQHVAG
jgi:hypothetical protein